MKQKNIFKKFSVKLKQLKIHRIVVYVLVTFFALAGLNCKNKLFEFPPSLNREPVAMFTFDNKTLNVEFDAEGSVDPDGEIVGYTWNFGDGSSGVGVHTFHNYQESGKYFVELNVKDDDDAEGSIIQEVNAFPDNIPPAAILSINATTGNLNSVWKLDGSASYDTDGHIVSYKFDIIRRSDGTTIKYFEGKQNTISFMFDKKDLDGKSSMNFKIILKVTDNCGDTSEDFKIITVEDL